MPDTKTVVHIGENSPEEIALKLMREVAAAENWQNVDRKKLLDTYAECLRAVQAPISRLRQ